MQYQTLVHRLADALARSDCDVAPLNVESLQGVWLNAGTSLWDKPSPFASAHHRVKRHQVISLRRSEDSTATAAHRERPLPSSAASPVTTLEPETTIRASDPQTQVPREHAPIPDFGV